MTGMPRPDAPDAPAEPGAESGPNPWELVARPHKSARIATVIAVLILIIFVLIAVFLPDEQSGVTFTGADQWGVAGVGVLIAIGILSFTRPRVRAGWPGVESRGFFGGPRLVEWPLIVSVDFVPKTRFARLVLPGDEAVALYAIQRGDAELSVEAMQKLRELHTRWAS